MTANAPSLNAELSRLRADGPDALPADLFERSDAKGLARLGVHLVILVCTASLLALSSGTFWLVPAIILHGVVLIFMFCPLHECIHSTAFKSRGLNDAVASVSGFLLLLPREYFRAFHLEHHRYTQDPKRDPELSVKKPERIGEYLLHLSGLSNWRERVSTLIRHARGEVTESFIPDGKRGAIVTEARWHLAAYTAAAVASLAAQSGVLLIYWVFPVMVGQPFLRAFLLAEHTGCPLVNDMFVNTRTTLTNPVVRMLTWNMPYHAEHHAWAAVPFHQLPRAHLQVRDRIAHLAGGYVAVHRSFLGKIGKFG